MPVTVLTNEPTTAVVEFKTPFTPLRSEQVVEFSGTATTTEHGVMVPTGAPRTPSRSVITGLRMKLIPPVTLVVVWAMLTTLPRSTTTIAINGGKVIGYYTYIS